jgi:hypothetical protein
VEARVIAPWTGHPILERAAAMVPLSYWDPDQSEDLRSVATLAMVEGADPLSAIKAERRRIRDWLWHRRPIVPDSSY